MVNLKDGDGKELEAGIYICRSVGPVCDICLVSAQGENFCARTWRGDFHGQARNLYRLSDPIQNAEFLSSILLELNKR
jgi:hypothetical protein